MILNCKKYSNRRHMQLDTWLKNITTPYYHVIGDENIATDFEINEDNRIITVKCRDTYEALPKKTYLGVKACISLFPHLQYILKTDDDMKCNINNLYKTIHDIQGYDYGGQLIECDTYTSDWHYQYVTDEFKIPFVLQATRYCPGRFYFLSKKACDLLVVNKDWMYKNIFEDYAVGYIMTHNSLNVLNLDAQSIFYDT
jgi:hypothetical protein